MLPPGPPEPSVIQTARWLLRPISFMESCRRRYGELFSVSFLGFKTPMVMLTDPAAIRALYTERKHGRPPGRGAVRGAPADAGGDARGDRARGLRRHRPGARGAAARVAPSAARRDG